MTREAFEIELNKLDLLHQKYTEAYETLLAHVRSGELNFLEWDDKTYKAAEAAVAYTAQKRCIRSVRV